MSSSPEPALPAPERTAIVRDSLGVGIATGAYGVSFGAVSVAAGLDVWQTCALSFLVFTGASQFQSPITAIMAASVVVTIPVIIIVLAFQRRIVAGLTSGAVKG